MVLKLYSLYDVKTEVFHPANYCHNVGHAMRVFTQAGNQKDSMIQAWPEDFRVFELGSFDDQSGVITPLDKPHLAFNMSELVTHSADVDGEGVPIPFDVK